MNKRKYTNEQIEWIKQNYPLYSMEETIKLFNEKFNMNISKSTFRGIIYHYHILCGRTVRFEKGYTPPPKGHPIGAESITKDGYIIVKLDAPYPHPISKLNPIWVFKQVYVYEQAYGPIPKGHKLIFLDGNRQNCELSNLQLISNDVHLRMNSNKYYNHSKEVTQAGIAIFQTEKLIKEELDNA
jgi:hypothetical protein